MTSPESSYAVRINPTAWKEIMRLNDTMQERILTAIENLEITPRPSGVVKMSGEANIYRVRVGNFRILYEIHDEILVIVVVKVGNRRDVYRR